MVLSFSQIKCFCFYKIILYKKYRGYFLLVGGNSYDKQEHEIYQRLRQQVAEIGFKNRKVVDETIALVSVSRRSGAIKSLCGVSRDIICT